MEIPYNKREVTQTIGLPLYDACRRFAGQRADEMFELYVNYQQTIHDAWIKEFPGTTDLLNKLKQDGYLLGVVTSKRRVMAERGLKVSGLNQLLDHLVALEDAPRPKPDPAPVLQALSNMQVLPSQCIYVGDSPHDLKSGQKAGVLTVGVTWGVSSPEDLLPEQPVALIHTWPELVRLLENLRQR